MARQAREVELLELRFKHYTADVRRSISRIVVNQCCKDTSDTVIDDLCKTCHDDITALLAKSGIDDAMFDENGDWQLTVEAREFIRTFIDQARSYEGELDELGDDDFEALYRATIGPIVEAERDRHAQSARDRDRWEFFNMPEADADFARWRGRLLSPAQAVALSFGKDPDVVKPERLTPYRKVLRSPFREAFKDRLDLIEAAVAAGEVPASMSVSTLDGWATSCGIDLPPALTGKEVATPGEDAVFWKTQFEAVQGELDYLRSDIDDLPPKSIGSIYKLLIGMAVARFEHVTDHRTSATTAIRDDLEKIGIKIHSGTILSHLRNAASSLDYNWTASITWNRVKSHRK